MRLCVYCNSSRDPASFFGARCGDCNRARKRAYTAENKGKRREHRAELAELAGRVFVPRGLHDAHCKAFSAMLEKVANDNRKTADRAASIANKPWLAPGLSAAEKYRLRYHHCKDFHLKERIRRQIRKKAKRDGFAEYIRQAIRRGGESRAVLRAFGYTITQLREHIEALFTEGMDWPAFMRGEIHIDHKMPQAAFDMSDEEQFRRCWALRNLRPMWANDNVRRGDMLDCGIRARTLRTKMVHA